DGRGQPRLRLRHIHDGRHRSAGRGLVGRAEAGAQSQRALGHPRRGGPRRALACAGGGDRRVRRCRDRGFRPGSTGSGGAFRRRIANARTRRGRAFGYRGTVTTTVLASFPSPPQGVWYIGPVAVRAYAIFIIIGIVIAIIWGDRRWVARGGEKGTVFDIAIWADRKSTRLNSSHVSISYAVFCLKK